MVIADAPEKAEIMHDGALARMYMTDHGLSSSVAFCLGRDLVGYALLRSKGNVDAQTQQQYHQKGWACPQQLWQ